MKTARFPARRFLDAAKQQVIPVSSSISRAETISDAARKIMLNTRKKRSRSRSGVSQYIVSVTGKKKNIKVSPVNSSGHSFPSGNSLQRISVSSVFVIIVLSTSTRDEADSSSGSPRCF